MGDLFLEDKYKHLEMIQNIIQRMATNSFMLKGWAVTLIVAIFALADKDMNQNYFWAYIYSSYNFLVFRFLLFAVRKKI